MDMDLGSPDLDLSHDVSCDFGGDGSSFAGMETTSGHGDFSGGFDADFNHNHDTNCDSFDMHGHVNDGDGTSINGGGHFDGCNDNNNQFDVELKHEFDNNSSVTFGHSEGPHGGETHLGLDWHFD